MIVFICVAVHLPAPWRHACQWGGQAGPVKSNGQKFFLRALTLDIE